jgi:hypothetical protein
MAGTRPAMTLEGVAHGRYSTPSFRARCSMK